MKEQNRAVDLEAADKTWTEAIRKLEANVEKLWQLALKPDPGWHEGNRLVVKLPKRYQR